ncbi:MAG: DsrE family protein [Phycisphaerales bacterium]|nr:DsrE family protein [Phycisphaerales bacterium]
MGTVISIGHDGMGHGDAELGRRILGTFLKKSIQIQDLSAITFHNAGVKLVAPDSPVRVELSQLHERGVEIKPCRTCLEFYGLIDRIAVGEIVTMDDIVAEWSRATKVISL